MNGIRDWLTGIWLWLTGQAEAGLSAVFEFFAGFSFGHWIAFGCAAFFVVATPVALVLGRIFRKRELQVPPEEAAAAFLARYPSIAAREGLELEDGSTGDVLRYAGGRWVRITREDSEALRRAEANA